MVQVADIIASVVMAVIIIAASVYLFAIYCHRTHPSTQPTSRA